MKLSARLCKVNQEIALKRSLTEHTVRNYLIRIFDKLGISSRVELVLYAFSGAEGMADPLASQSPFRFGLTQNSNGPPDIQKTWRSTNTGESNVSHPDLRRAPRYRLSGQPRNRMGFCASAGAHTRHQRRRNVRRSRRCALGGRGFSRSSAYGKTLLAGLLGEARGTRALTVSLYASKSLGEDVGGLLGMDFLNEFHIVVVDLRQHKLILEP